MRIARIASATAVAGAALLAATPTAFADNGGGPEAEIHVVPRVATPDSAVKVHVECSGIDDPTTTKVFSRAFEAPVTLHQVAGKPEHFRGKTEVGEDVDPGRFSVEGACLSENGTATEFETSIRIVNGRPVEVVHRRHEAREAVAPMGAAETGDGASQASVASTPTILEGGALTAAGLGLGLLAVRRRRAGARG